jgi:hypothetical protein
MSEATVPLASRPANPAGRVAAFIGGLAVLGISLVISFGTVLAGLAAIGLCAWIVSRRGGVLGRGGRWLAGICGVAVVLLAAAGVGVALTSKATWQAMKHAADSVNAAPQAPPPAWVERLSPGITQRSANARQSSGALQTGMMIWSAAFGLMFIAALSGSLAWCVAMLFGFAVKGHWPGAQPEPVISHFA